MLFRPHAEIEVEQLFEPKQISINFLYMIFQTNICDYSIIAHLVIATLDRHIYPMIYITHAHKSHTKTQYVARSASRSLYF